jgi:hypothetical protein
MNNPFDSRFNDRFNERNEAGSFDGFDTRADEGGLFDNRTDVGSRRTGDTRRTQRPMTPPGLDRARQQLDANQQRFEERTGDFNRGLDTARDRIDRNLDRFDDRINRSVDRIDRGARFDAGVGEDELGTGMPDDPRLRNRGSIDRGARFDAGVGEDELGTGMPDDPRLRNRGSIDRGARFDAGVGEDELGTGMPDDPRLRRDGIDRGGRFDAVVGDDELGTGIPDDPRFRRGDRRFVDRTDNRTFNTGRDRLGAVTDGGVRPLSTAADPRLDAPRRTFAEEIDVRARDEFRDDLGVRRNLSSGPRQTGFRGIGPTPERMDLNGDGLDDGISPTTRALSDWLDRTARGLDRLNDRLNRRPVGERIE